MRHIRLRGPAGVEACTVDGSTVQTEDGSQFEALDELTLALPEPYELLRPVDPPEVWCSGVTYERSRDARIEESGSDVYARVYDADRPELFLKDAACRRTVGPGDPIGIRSDATLERSRARDRPGHRRRRLDRRLHDRQRRVVARHRGREPAVPAPGEGVRERLLDRPGRVRAG